MPFGNPITEGAAQILSVTGAVYAFDLSNQVPDVIQRVVLYDAATNDSILLTEDSGLDAILRMPFVANQPDAAWAQSGNVVYVFVKLAVYAADANSRIAFWMKAHAPIMTTLDGTLSIPASARALLAALVDEGEGEGKPDFFQSEGVRAARAELGV